MSIKTSKRIALGVITALVFAPFAAIAPASAAAHLKVERTSPNIVRGDLASAAQDAGVTQAVIESTLTGDLAGVADVLRIRVEQTANVAVFPIGVVAPIGGTTANVNTATTVTGGTGVIRNRAPAAQVAGPPVVLAESFTRAFDIGVGVANARTAITPGTYVFKVFVDANLNGSFDSGEANQDVTVIFANAPFTSTVTADRSTVPLANTNVTYTVAVTDVNGNPTTALNAAPVTLTKFATNAAGTAVTAGAPFDRSTAAAALDINAGRVGLSNIYRSVITYTHAGGAANDAVGFTYTYRSNFRGLATAFPGASFSVPDASVATMTGLAMTPQAGLFFGAVGAGGSSVIPAVTPAINAGVTVTVSADVTVTSINITLTGTPNKVYAVTTTRTGTSDATRVTAPATVRTVADGTVTFTVANSAPKASATTGSDAVLISITDTTAAGALTGAYQINYVPVTAVWTLSPATNFDVLEKSSNTVTATITDNFARVLPNVAYSVSVAGRNVAASSGVTSATGTATYTVADTATTSYATVGGFPSDAVTFANVATTTIPAATRSVTFTYKATLAAVGTVTLSVAAGNVTVDLAEANPGLPADASRATYTATVRTAAGATVAAGTLVTFAGGADDLFLNSVKTGVTNANGEATATVYRQKIGNALITATANGVAGSAVAKRWVTTNGGRLSNGDLPGGANDNTAARNIRVTAAQTIVPGSAATVIATVSDRWGNPISGALITFSTSGVGRAILGADATVGTDTNGNAQFQVTSLATETGVMTVTALVTGTDQTSDLAGRVAGVRVAGVTAGNDDASSRVTFAAPVVVAPVVPTVVVPPVAPTLTAERQGNRVLLFGTCMVDEGDIIIYVKSPGKAYSEKAKTLECADGEYDGSLRASKDTKFYRVKQEGTGLYSTSRLIRP